MPLDNPEIKVARGRAKTGTTLVGIVPGVGVHSTSTVTLETGYVYYFPMLVETDITISGLTMQITTAAAAGKLAGLGIYNADTDWQPTTLVVDAGTIAIDALAVVTKSVTQFLPAGRYLLAFTSNENAVFRLYRGSLPFSGIPLTMGSAVINALYVAKAYAAYADPGTAWDTFGSADTSGFFYATLVSVSVP